MIVALVAAVVDALGVALGDGREVARLPIDARLNRVRVSVRVRVRVRLGLGLGLGLGLVPIGARLCLDPLDLVRQPHHLLGLGLGSGFE